MKKFVEGVKELLKEIHKNTNQEKIEQILIEFQDKYLEYLV